MKTMLFITTVLVGYFVGTLLLGLGGFTLPIGSALLEAAVNTLLGLAMLGVAAAPFSLVKPSPDAHAEP